MDGYDWLDMIDENGWMNIDGSIYVAEDWNIKIHGWILMSEDGLMETYRMIRMNGYGWK